MVRVNRNQLTQKNAERLLQRFDSTFAKLDNKTVTVFLDALLGKEERLTIAKRFAAIVLLQEGYSEYKVADLLKLSHSTTGLIAKKLKEGSYNNIIRQLKKKKFDYIKLLDAIDSILLLNGLLPRRVGLDRYRNLNANRKR